MTDQEFQKRMRELEAFHSDAIQQYKNAKNDEGRKTAEAYLKRVRERMEYIKEKRFGNA